MNDLKLKEQIALTARMLVRAGLIVGFGHVSARTKDGLFITNTQPLAYTVAKDILFYSFSSSAKIKKKNIPLETPMHAAIYNKRKNVKAICRGHGQYVSAWAVSSEELPLLHGLGAIAGEKVNNHNDINLITSSKSATNLAKTLGTDASLILGSNGCLATGGNLLEAAVRLYFLEERARIAILARNTGIKLRKISKKDWEKRISNTRAETLRAMKWFEKTFGETKNDLHD